MSTSHLELVADTLLVVDVQRDLFIGEHAVAKADRILGIVRQLIDRALAGEATVILLQNDGGPAAADEVGTDGWELALPPPACGRSWVLPKHLDDGFAGTDLDGILRSVRSQRLVVCGALSEMCVSATARSAIDRGYAVILPHDAHGSRPIPAVTGFGRAISAATVSRVAEWALGDAVVLTPDSRNVQFCPPPAPHPTRNSTAAASSGHLSARSASSRLLAPKRNVAGAT